MENFVGYSTVQLTDEQNNVTFPLAIMYPTVTPGKEENFGPYSMDVALDAAPKAGLYPLVMISHGSGGAPLAYRTMAHYLAMNGFIVGLPEHPFNNRNNNAWEGTVDNLVNRPRHLRQAINWFYASQFAKYLKPDAVAVIGHSMGGYTALAVAGGSPTSLPEESPDGQIQKISIVPDSRVKALVLLAPAAPWYKDEGSLSRVNIPILMLVGEKDEFTPWAFLAAQLILDRVPDKAKVDYRMIKNVGHYSFLSPFPESMTRTDFPPSQDPEGFARKKFHPEFNAAVLDFLVRNT